MTIYFAVIILWTVQADLHVSCQNFTYGAGVSLIAGQDSPLEHGTSSLMHMPRLSLLAGYI